MDDRSSVSVETSLSCAQCGKPARLQYAFWIFFFFEESEGSTPNGAPKFSYLYSIFYINFNDEYIVYLL